MPWVAEHEASLQLFANVYCLCLTRMFYLSVQGVEFGVACFCGPAPPPGPQLPLSECASMPCASAASEACGGADIISVFPAACPVPPGVPPNLVPNASFVGAARMYLSTPRTTIGASEGSLNVQV
jgi:hypothetical protein